MAFPPLNLEAVVAAAVASYVLGAVWYGALGNPWAEALDKTRDELGGGATGYMASAAAAFVTAIVLAWVLGWANAANLTDGAIVGAVAAIGFVATASAAHHFFEERATNLYLINNGYHLVSFILMGAILGFMS